MIQRSEYTKSNCTRSPNPNTNTSLSFSKSRTNTSRTNTTANCNNSSNVSSNVSTSSSNVSTSSSSNSNSTNSNRNSISNLRNYSSNNSNTDSRSSGTICCGSSRQMFEHAPPPKPLEAPHLSEWLRRLQRSTTSSRPKQRPPCFGSPLPNLHACGSLGTPTTADATATAAIAAVPALPAAVALAAAELRFQLRARRFIILHRHRPCTILQAWEPRRALRSTSLLLRQQQRQQPWQQLHTLAAVAQVWDCSSINSKACRHGNVGGRTIATAVETVG